MYPPPPIIRPKDTVIVEAGASGIYMTTEFPCVNQNINLPPVIVVTATGKVQKSVSSCTIPLPQLPFHQGHIMPNFSHSIMVIGPLCEKGCSVIYYKESVTVLSPTIEVLLPIL